MKTEFSHYSTQTHGKGQGVEFETTYSIFDDKKQKNALEYACNNYSDYDLTRFYIYVFFPK